MEDFKVVVSYKPLWHLLVDKNMNKTDLKQAPTQGFGNKEEIG